MDEQKMTWGDYLSWKARAEAAEEQVAELKREVDAMARAPYGQYEAMRERADAAEEREKALRTVAHQIIGFSRTVQGEQSTVQAIARNAEAALNERGRASDERAAASTHG